MSATSTGDDLGHPGGGSHTITCVACRSAKVKCKPMATADGVRTVRPESTPVEGGDGKLRANETAAAHDRSAVDGVRNAVACQRCQRLSLVCVPTPPSRRGRPGERRGKRRRVDPTATVSPPPPKRTSLLLRRPPASPGCPARRPGRRGRQSGLAGKRARPAFGRQGGARWAHRYRGRTPNARLLSSSMSSGMM